MENTPDRSVWQGGQGAPPWYSPNPGYGAYGTPYGTPPPGPPPPPSPWQQPGYPPAGDAPPVPSYPGYGAYVS